MESQSFRERRDKEAIEQIFTAPLPKGEYPSNTIPLL
jgi:hypothetical protein